jgi:hypothetical protein
MKKEVPIYSEEEIINIALEELKNPRFTFTKDVLDTHEFVLDEMNRPKIKRIGYSFSKKNALVYFSIKGYPYYFVIRVLLRPELRVLGMGLTPSIEMKYCLVLDDKDKKVELKKIDFLNSADFEIEEHDDGLMLNPIKETAYKFLEKLYLFADVIKKYKKELIQIQKKFCNNSYILIENHCYCNITQAPDLPKDVLRLFSELNIDLVFLNHTYGPIIDLHA